MTTLDDTPTNKLINFDAIPQDLTQKNNWVLWCYQTRGEKKTKVPFNPNPDLEKMRVDFAASNDSESWGSLDLVQHHLRYDIPSTNRYKKRKYDGAGFVFDGTGIIGLDLDNVIDDHGRIDPAFIDVLTAFEGTYMEISPSGHGIHIFIECEINPYKRGRCAKRDDGKEIGIYSEGRFFTMTGNKYEKSGDDILDYDPEDIREILKDWITEEKEHVRILSVTNMSDFEIIKIAESAKNGQKFSGFFRNGDCSGYPSRSEADQAFCQMIAFYTQDPARIESIMQQSAMIRDKWKRPDYLPRTIRTALRNTTTTYLGEIAKRRQEGWQIMKDLGLV